MNRNGCAFPRLFTEKRGEKGRFSAVFVPDLRETPAEQAMQVEPEAPAERRAHPRYSVDEDSVLLVVGSGPPVPSRILDLSLEGCQIRTRERICASLRSRVEVTFRINGIAFRLSGITQWTDGRHVAGVRFADMPARRRNELAEVLGEMEAAKAAEATKAAKTAARKLELEGEAAGKRAPKAPADQVLVPTSAPGKPAAHASERSARPLDGQGPAAGERRAYARHEVDTSVFILLVNIAARLEGRILDLSVGGCRIRTAERFPVGIYTRVEMEFHLEGLPFRLGGVVQAIHDRHHVGIRFLDVSERKRSQVMELIEEMDAMRRLTQPTGGSE